MKRIIFLLVTALTPGISSVGAQEQTDTVVTIISSITSGGRNTVAQPEALTRLLRRLDKAAGASEDEARPAQSARQRVGGYRIQMFLDNNASTAKANARRKASEVSSRFPEMRTYVTYNAPYWRLRVGDFRSQAEANEAAAKLRAAFPASAKEIRVVRDNINH